MLLSALRSAWFITLFLSSVSLIQAEEVYDLGARRELFVDRHRIESMTGSARLELHTPEPAEVAIKFDEPWELGASAFVTVFQDGDKVRMYYRGAQSVEATGESKSNLEVACYAE